MSDARPMEPRDAHEIMRRVVEADELDIRAIGRELRGLEAQRDHVASLAVDSDRFTASAAEWQEAYDNARRYVEKTLERRGKLVAVVVDLALEQAAAVERERETGRRLERLERATAHLVGDALRADPSLAAGLAAMSRRATQEAEPHPSHRTLVSAERFDILMAAYGIHAEEHPGEGWVWCPRTRRAAPAHHFDGRH